MADVIVIGAGVAGSAVARELARWQLDVVVLEAGYDLACGASRTNSGIVHGGYDPVPGTLKARYNVEGMRMFPALAQELGFRYKNTGSLVVALSEGELGTIRELVARGHENGVDVREVGPGELHELEPNLAPTAAGALLCTESGICDPFGTVVAFAENAVANGVTFRFRSRVEHVRHAASGQGWEVELEDGERIAARVVVNAAGCHADVLNNEVSATKIEMRPRLGEYVLMSRAMGPTFSHTMFQAPGPLGKGVLVSPTVEGNLIVGPDALDHPNNADTSTNPEGLATVVEQAMRTWPQLNRREIIVNFAGIRPSGADGDFVVGQPDDAPGFFNIAAFDSPGLSSAPAVAVDVSQQIARLLGAEKNDSFEPHRDRPPRFLEASDEERAALVASDPRYGHIVCRCECVSEAEVLAAIHAPIPATTVVGIKRRCRAGTGRCQGGFCAPIIAELICRETGMDIHEVCEAEPGSELAPLPRGEARL